MSHTSGPEAHAPHADASEARTGPRETAGPDEPTLAELTARAVAIDLPTYHEDITEAILRVGGDIARALGDARGCRRPFDVTHADLGREFGNLAVSALRWMVAYGLDPAECIAAAEAAQRAYALTEETDPR